MTPLLADCVEKLERASREQRSAVPLRYARKPRAPQSHQRLVGTQINLSEKPVLSAHGAELRVHVHRNTQLGILTIRDRVAQMAVLLLVLGPILDEDRFSWQYGFREGLDAKMALRRIHFGIADRGAREVVDADLAGYVNTIPHGDLLRCVARRVADGTVLAVIRQRLDAAVIECPPGGGEFRTTAARDTNRSTPQGGVISPLLANLYFRRFILAWYDGGANGLPRRRP